MKIRKKALRRFIRESIYKNSRQATRRARRASSIDPLAAVEEMGYDVSQHPALDSNSMAIDDANLSRMNCTTNAFARFAGTAATPL